MIVGYFRDHEDRLVIDTYDGPDVLDVMETDIDPDLSLTGCMWIVPGTIDWDREWGIV